MKWPDLATPAPTHPNLVLKFISRCEELTQLGLLPCLTHTYASGTVTWPGLFLALILSLTCRDDNLTKEFTKLLYLVPSQWQILNILVSLAQADFVNLLSWQEWCHCPTVPICCVDLAQP